MAAIVNTINQFLEHRVGVTNANMRDRIARAGHSDLVSLVKKEPDFANKVCAVVRKSTGGNAANKDVSVNVEEGLGMLILYARYMYMVQRTLDFGLATLDNLDDIGSWFNQLGKNQPTGKVEAFPDNDNMKAWFESIIGHLRNKIGMSGVPLEYVVRETIALPLVDQGYATPSLEQEMSARARHDGHYWRGDNKMVWLFIEDIL